MKYETYKTLTPEQKEEYNYKFSEAPQPPLQSMTHTAILVWLVLSVMVMAVYITYLDPKPELVALRPQLTQTLQVLGGSMKVWALMVLTYLAFWIWKVAWFIVEKRKWQKKNGVLK